MIDPATRHPLTLDHPRYKIIPRAGSRKLAVFFSGTGEADGRFHFFGAARRCGENVLCLNNGANRWYQQGVPGLGDTLDDTLKSIRRWSEALDAPELHFVGASMGGAGAVLYGALTGSPVLAFGFEARLFLEQSRSARLADPTGDYPYRDLTPLLERATAPVHVYVGADDPEDLLATLHVRHLPEVRLTALRGVSHGPAQTLKADGLLDPMIAAFLAGEPMPRSSRADASVFAEGYAPALNQAWCGYRTGDVGRWIDGGERAVALLPSAGAARYWLGRGLLKAGRLAEALVQFGAGVALNDDDPLARYFFAHTLRAMGREDEALSLHADSIRRWPDSALAHYDTGFILAKKGRLEEAAGHLRTAVDLAPLNRAYADRLAKVRAKLDAGARSNRVEPS